MTESAEAPSRAFSARTAWARSLETPLREFLRTETGSAAFLLAATLVGARLGQHRLWLVRARLADAALDPRRRLGRRAGSAPLGEQRADDVLLLRHRARGAARVRHGRAAGAAAGRAARCSPASAGWSCPIAIFLAVNAGHSSAHGWGVAMSTDTAFALGMLALVGPRFPDRLRAFMLTVVVVDDVVALVVIATVYSGHVALTALLVAVGIFGVDARRSPAPGSATGSSTWRSARRRGWRSSKSGVDPVVVGLAMGLLDRTPIRRRAATSSARPISSGCFREQPTPELERDARAGLRSAISPNERLQQLYHPWTSYVIVPLFALANAGIAINGGFLSRAYTSPITLGILIGYVVGKPVGIAGDVLARDEAEPRPPAAAGRLGRGRGRGRDRRDRLHGLAADRDARLPRRRSSRRRSSACCRRRSSRRSLTWLVFRAAAQLPRRLRIRALLGTAEPIVDLAEPVDPERDHIRGPAEAPVTVRRVRRLRVPLLRAGRAGRARAARRLRRRPLRLAAPAAHRRPPARASRRRGGRGGRRAGDVLGDARPAARPPGRAARRRPDAATRRSSASTSSASRRTCAEHTGAGADRGGRRLRRSERRLRHADVLHQRPAALRRLRHRDALGRGAGGSCTRRDRSISLIQPSSTAAEIRAWSKRAIVRGPRRLRRVPPYRCAAAPAPARVASRSAIAVWTFLLGNAAGLVWLWWHGGNVTKVHTTGEALTSAARLTGLLSAYLALIQVVLLARLPFLERLVGFDRLTVWHRWNGHACLDLVLAHVVFSIWGYALMDHLSIAKEISTMIWGGIYPGMITATIGTVLLIAVVVSSIVIVRRRLRYEWWYAVHLTAYAGIALAWFHQIPTGNELVLDRIAADYWTSLYIATLALLVVFRLGVPIAQRVPLPAARRRRRRRRAGRRLAAHHRPRPRPAEGATGPVLPLALPRARPLVGVASVLALGCADGRLAAHHRQGARRLLGQDPPRPAGHARRRRGPVRRRSPSACAAARRSCSSPAASASRRSARCSRR